MTLIVQVWMQPSAEAASRAGRFQVIEVSGCDWPRFCAQVSSDDLIIGQQLHTRRIDDGHAEIFRRLPIAFRGSAVARCQPNTVECVDVAA